MSELFGEGGPEGGGVGRRPVSPSRDLDHEQHSQRIRRIVERRTTRIVRTADGVVPRVFDHREFHRLIAWPEATRHMLRHFVRKSQSCAVPHSDCGYNRRD